MPRAKARPQLSNPTTTAHVAWDATWAQAGSRAAWLRPERWVRDTLPLLRKHEVQRVLDLGSGVGRHAQFFAQEGFLTSGYDASPTGIDYARKVAESAGLDIDYQVGSFTSLPWEDATFDYVLSWHTLYHGDGDAVRQAFKEVNRVLRPGGIFQGTMLSKRNHRYGEGDEVAPDTFVINGAGEKSHPHFYISEQELRELLEGYTISTLRDNDYGYAGKNHIEFLAEKPS
jgi:tellurite methyltransferase